MSLFLPCSGLAADAPAFYRSGSGGPQSWLADGYVYVSSLEADIVPGGRRETVSLVGQLKPGARTSVVGLVLYRGKGRKAQYLASVAWPARSGWDHGLSADEFLDLDGDGTLEVGVRESAGVGTWSVQATTYYRLSGGRFFPVFHITRRAISAEQDEQRDMVVERKGRLRERVTVKALGAVPANVPGQHEYDVIYHFSPERQRFAPVSTRVLR